MLQTLQRELSEAQQLALCLDDKIQENVDLVCPDLTGCSRKVGYMLQTIQRELSEAQQLALCLDDKIEENVECAQTLQAVAER